MNMAQQTHEMVLNGVELFCLTAEAGSFTAAAIKAGVTQPAISRAISRLELRLGVRLFVRTTRSMKLTDAGQRYLQQCQQVLALINEAERELTSQQIKPTGTVRISVPTPIGHYLLLPLVPKFKEKYPDIHLSINLSNFNIDFVADGYDLAIRGRVLPDSSLIARHLIDAELVVVASAAYLHRAGAPESLDDIAKHDCIQFLLPSSGQTLPWLFKQNMNDIEIPVRGGISCSEDILACASLAKYGAGLTQTYRFIVNEDLQQGNLVELLETFGGRSRPFSLIYPQNRYMPMAVRLLVDFLVAEFKYL